MQFIIKLSVTVVIIVICAEIGKRTPSLAGLIATMPITSLLVLVWIYSANSDKPDLMVGYTKGALFGILPSILFFVVAYFCFRKELPLSIVLGASFAVWLVGAFVHQWLLR